MSANTGPRPNPFPGLRPFRSDEHHLFFGREEQTTALLELLRTNRFLAVVGTSGSGKSSLVRAGMMAELYGGTMTQAGSAWEVIILRPGGSPIENLARAMVEADFYAADDPSSLPRLRATLSRSRFGLVEAVKQSDLFEPGTNLLVVVDQFEELFRFRQQGVGSAETAAAFVNLLLTASEQEERPIYVTLTMRSDYLGDCSEIPGLAEAVNEGEYLIPRLLRDQKRDAIEKPIGVGGARISPLLVQRLLNDVGDDPDQLPVLQHALMRMWDVWSAQSDSSRPIDFCDFEATGGLASALSHHADEIYDGLPDDPHRKVCERIFKTLTIKGEDNRGIRRPTRLAELEATTGADRATVIRVLDAFRNPGVTFIMPGMEVELGDGTVLDLSHESLMRCWQRLRGWVEEEAQSARVFRRLLDTARLWRDGNAGLFRDPDLQIALSWREQQQPNTEWAGQYGGNLDAAIEFLDRSSQEARAEEQVREAARQRELEQARQLAEAQQLRLEQQQRSARKQRLMIAGLTVIALIAGLACLAALVANNKANRLAQVASREAEKARDSAEEADRQREAAQHARQEMRTERDVLAHHEYLLHLASANKAFLQNKLLRVGIELDRCKEPLRGWDWHFLDRRSRSPIDDAFTGAARPCFTSDGERLIARGTSQDENKAIVWDLSSGSRLAELAHEGSVRSVALSADDKWLAVGQNNGVLVLWNLATQEQKWAVRLHSGRFNDLAFSPDGGLIATSNRDGMLKVVNTSDGAVKFTQSLASLGKVMFSHDGHWLAAESDPSVLVNVTSGMIAIRFPPLAGLPTFSPEGRLIATGSPEEQAITLWEWDGEQLIQKESWKGASSSRFQDLCFHPDGTHLVSVQGAFVMVWDVATTKPVAGVVTDGFMGSLAVSPKGHTIACSGGDSIHLWRYMGHDDRLTVRPHHTASQLVQFSPDGKKIAIGSHRGQQELSVRESPGPVIVLDAKSGDHIITISIPCLGFSWMPDNQRIVVTRAQENTHEIYDATTGAALGKCEGNFAVGRPFVDETGQRLTSVRADSGSVIVVRTWDLESMQLRETFEVGNFWGGGNPRRPVGGFTSAVVGPDGYHVAVASGGDARIWDTRKEDPTQSLSLGGRIAETLAFTPDGGRIYVSAGRENFRLFDIGSNIESNRVISEFVGPAGEVDMSPDQKYVVSSGDGVVIWDVENGIPLITLSATEDRGYISVDWSPTQQRIAAGRSDGTVDIWTIVTDIQLHSDRARAQEELQEWAAAAAAWSGAVDGNPDGARLLIEFAKRLKDNGQSPLAASQLERARQLLDSALQGDPGNDLILERLVDLDVAVGTAHARKGQVDEAAAAFVRAFDRASAPKAKQKIIAEFKGFREVLTALVQLRPEDSEFQVALTTGLGDLFAAEQDWKGAIAYYDRAITREPADAALLVKRGVAHAEAGQRKQARADWKHVLELSSDAEGNGSLIKQALDYGDLILIGNSLIAARAEWRYHDMGKDLGNEWRVPDYDDLSWKEGAAQLGYGDSPATTLSYGEDPDQKHPCYYFRRSFEFAGSDPSKVLLLKLLIDDGCVVYLNGQELVRQNMPEGGISYNTWARGVTSDTAETTWITYAFSSARLAKDRNVLAVEVHQTASTSTDVRFDLELLDCAWAEVREAAR